MVASIVKVPVLVGVTVATEETESGFVTEIWSEEMPSEAPQVIVTGSPSGSVFETIVRTKESVRYPEVLSIVNVFCVGARFKTDTVFVWATVWMPSETETVIV